MKQIDEAQAAMSHSQGYIFGSFKLRLGDVFWLADGGGNFDGHLVVLLSLGEFLASVWRVGVYDPRNRLPKNRHSLNIVGGEGDFLVTDFFHLLNLIGHHVGHGHAGIHRGKIPAIGILLEERLAQVSLLFGVGLRHIGERLVRGIFLGVGRRRRRKVQRQRTCRRWQFVFVGRRRRR